MDLEILLPKTGRKPGSTVSEERRIELVLTSDSSYIAPKQDSENRITSIRRWEQAFRVYAAIYTDENPERSSEIWQYIYTINTAAAAYNWENVAFYDYTFRQLMAQKPWHSWAKTYNQGWNLALKGTNFYNSANNLQTYNQNTSGR